MDTYSDIIIDNICAWKSSYPVSPPNLNNFTNSHSYSIIVLFLHVYILLKLIIHYIQQRYVQINK